MPASGRRPACRFHTVWNKHPATSHDPGRSSDFQRDRIARFAGFISAWERNSFFMISNGALLPCRAIWSQERRPERISRCNETLNESSTWFSRRLADRNEANRAAMRQFHGAAQVRGHVRAGHLAAAYPAASPIWKHLHAHHGMVNIRWGGYAGAQESGSGAEHEGIEVACGTHHVSPCSGASDRRMGTMLED